MLLPRILDLKLPPGQSAFLWGPRKTGKTTLLRERFAESVVYDFLQADLHLEFAKNPSLLRQQLMALEPEKLKKPVLLDEVQKIPALLDEVHWLIENKGLSFILCGSSARKLKRGHANLLGGRAWRYELFPLVTVELDQPPLLRMLNQGLIPGHYLQDGESARRSLKAYVQDYLKEEVFAEALTRNIPAFSRFFDSMGYSHGQLVNYSNVARDCGVNSKTVQEYYRILEDTLLGTTVEPYKKRQNRQVITKAPKFYLFDVGVAGILTDRRIPAEKGEAFGAAFEHLIFMELNAYRKYSEKDFPIHFWRTKSGMEVDFVLGDGEVAVEAKGSARVDSDETRGMAAFHGEFSPRKALIVSNESQERVVGGLRLVPWRIFLEDLWAGRII